MPSTQLTIDDFLSRPLVEEIDKLLDAAGWADDEIQRACRKYRVHKREAELQASFPLLRPRLAMPERLFRAHCRELLTRVVTGEDTRPATAGEYLAVLIKVSVEIKLPTAGMGLYLRMWNRAGLPPNAIGDLADQYAAVSGQATDDLEGWLARRLRQSDRVA